VTTSGKIPLGQIKYKKLILEYAFAQIIEFFSDICLVIIAGREMKIDRSTYEILQILCISLLDKTPVKELLTNINYKNVNELNCKQLSLNLF